MIESGVALSDVLRAESFSALKKKSVGIRRSTSRKGGFDGKKQPGDGTLKPNNVDPSKSKQLKDEDKPASHRRVSPPLQKQMASRAA